MESDTQRESFLSQILAIAGTLFVSAPGLTAAFTLVLDFALERDPRAFDALFVPLIFLAPVGGAMLLWAALRLRARQRFIGGALALAVGLPAAGSLFFGLATAATAVLPNSMAAFDVALAGLAGSIVLSAVACIVAGVGGVLMLRDILTTESISVPLFVVIAGLAVPKALAGFLAGMRILALFDLLSFLLDQAISGFVIIGLSVAFAASLSRHRPKLAGLLACLVSVLLLMIPVGQFRTLGTWLFIRSADPVLVRDDARALMNIHQPMTYFGHKERPLLDHPLSTHELPASLQAVTGDGVLVLEDYVLIGEQGLCCLFRGFVVFKEGADVWADQPEAILLAGCTYCWRIRIIDGLYWYHAVPQQDEVSTFMSPLE